MALITLPGSEWVDILTLSGVSPGTDTLLRNYGSTTILVAVQATAPTASAGFPMLVGDMVSVHNEGQKIWVKGSVGVRVWIDLQADNLVSLYSDVSVQEPLSMTPTGPIEVNSAAPLEVTAPTPLDVKVVEPLNVQVQEPLNVVVPTPVMIAFPADMVTGTPGDPTGSRRLRTDQGQTSFWQGRQYRTFQELNITGGATHTIRIVTGVNTILKGLSLNIWTGDAKLSIISGGTAGGTYGTTLPIIRKNSMTVTPNIASQNVLTSGGTVTGGTIIDVIRVVTAEGQGNRKEASVGETQDDERAVAPGTFFYRIEAIGTAAVTGVINFFWEER